MPENPITHEREYFFNEVGNDINILEKAVESGYPNLSYEVLNSTKNHSENPLIGICQMIKEKYEKEYCPCQEFKLFTESEKMNYIVLRSKIDQLLDIRETKYKF